MKIGWKAAECLRLLLEHGGRWWPGCGWRYESSTATLRHMEALARLALVQQVPTTGPHIEWHVTDPERAYAAIATAKATPVQRRRA